MEDSFQLVKPLRLGYHKLNLKPFIVFYTYNEIQNYNNSKTLNFADDTLLYTTFQRNIYVKDLNLELINKNSDSLNVNKLKLNVNKTRCMLFHL